MFNYREKITDVSIDFIWKNEELKTFHCPEKYWKVWDQTQNPPKNMKRAAQHKQEGKSSVLSTCPFRMDQKQTQVRWMGGRRVASTAGWYFGASWCQAGLGNSFCPSPWIETCRLSAHAPRLLKPQAESEERICLHPINPQKKTQNSKSRGVCTAILCIFQPGMHGQTWICVAALRSCGAGGVNQRNAERGTAGVQKYVSTWANTTSPKYVFAQT